MNIPFIGSSQRNSSLCCHQCKSWWTVNIHKFIRLKIRQILPQTVMRCCSVKISNGQQHLVVVAEMCAPKHFRWVTCHSVYPDWEEKWDDVEGLHSASLPHQPLPVTCCTLLRQVSTLILDIRMPIWGEKEGWKNEFAEIDTFMNLSPDNESTFSVFPLFFARSFGRRLGDSGEFEKTFTSALVDRYSKN